MKDARRLRRSGFPVTQEALFFRLEEGASAMI